MKLEDKLLSLRKQQGLTQLELAEALHISRQAISKWETGEAEPSLENLKSLSQIYHISLDELLREGKLPEPKAPPEDQPLVQPPQEEPKEKTDGEPPAAVSAGEEAPPQKPPRRKKVMAALLLGWAAVLSIGIVAGYLWWNSQPAQQFLYWNEGEASSTVSPRGLELSIDVTRFSDGSGSIEYILQNTTNAPCLFSTYVWIDYKYQGTFHCISASPDYERTIPLSGTGGGVVIDPGENWSDTFSLPGKMLARPGHYRFCAENWGLVEFAVFEDGDVLVGKSLNG